MALFTVFNDALIAQPSTFYPTIPTPSVIASPRVSSSTRKARKGPSSILSLRSSALHEDQENINPLTGHRTTSNNPKAKKPKANAGKTFSKSVDASSLLAGVKSNASSSRLPVSSFASEFFGFAVVTLGSQEVADTTQAFFNSLCYDLTVSPLADVSEAYNVGRPDSLEAHSRENKESDPFVSEEGVEEPALICDIILNDLASTSTPSAPVLSAPVPSETRQTLSTLGSDDLSSAISSGVKKGSKSKSAKRRL
ncbi:hypothetical protein K435DRAFT_964528 [Dendrothele bispora CBS 962.96]|uniref:Uncharacterized protein n=1 Tax=Dendrothele bispora (strain CBS 962.96) TaxID=1314807 RepID=A0A4S8MA38_DENBC|nr:hypothetical protein K435DRAFT_964528 [Dendrothele bispora CBS 962.96]